MMQVAWTKPSEAPEGSRGTGDPLGFRALATELARTLAPGLTQGTAMVRGFSLLCLGLDLAGEAMKAASSRAAFKGPPRAEDTFQRFERLCFASRVHHGEPPFAGSQRAPSPSARRDRAGACAFYAGKVVLHPEMANPTLIVLTDRNDLDEQLFGTFARCKELLRQSPEHTPAIGRMCASCFRLRPGGVVYDRVVADYHVTAFSSVREADVDAECTLKEEADAE